MGNEVTGPQAAEILGISISTVHRKVDAGVLPARQQGTGERQFIFIESKDLRTFAEAYGYRIDDSLLRQYESE